MITLESLLPYAQRLAQLPHNENARSNLVLRLQLTSDGDMLRELAARFIFQPEVMVPVWRRVAELEKENPRGLVEAAGVLYSVGLDDEAGEWVDAAITLDKNFVRAWELKAALCADPGERRAVYEHILQIEPGNRTAVDALIVLGRPKD